MERIRAYFRGRALKTVWLETSLLFRMSPQGLLWSHFTEKPKAQGRQRHCGCLHTLPSLIFKAHGLPIGLP